MFFLVEFLVALLSIVACFLIYFYFYRRHNQSYKPIPGWNKEPDDPKLGDLKIALSTGSLQEYICSQHQEGKVPVIAFWWKEHHVVSICSTESFKDTEHLYNRPSLIFDPCSAPLHGWSSIQSVNNEEWKRMGKQYRVKVRGDNLELFHNDFVQVAHETANKWSTSNDINLMTDLFHMTLKSILATLLGNIFENDEDKIDEIAHLYHICKLEMDQRILDSPPPNSTREINFQRNLKSLQKYLQQIIDAGKKRGKNDKQLPLMEELAKSDESSEQIMSHVTTFMAGFHTSSYYLTWLLYYLAQTPQVQNKLMSEINDKVGQESGEKLKNYVMSQMTYLRQVLDEALRKSSTAAFTAHYSNTDMNIHGHLIPAKTPIIHAIGVAMHNTDDWKCPAKFDPDRFVPECKHAKRGHEFRPFGVSSPRRCPANHFTYLMASVFVTVLLREFIFSIDAENENDVKKKYGIATSPNSEIHFCVKPRN